VNQLYLQLYWFYVLIQIKKNKKNQQKNENIFNQITKQKDMQNKKVLIWFKYYSKQYLTHSMKHAVFDSIYLTQQLHLLQGKNQKYQYFL